MKNIDTALSSRFRFISSVALVSVIIIHSKFIMSRWADIMETQSLVGKISWGVQFILSENIARIAVPIFFFISGFFITQKYDSSLESYKREIRKRVKTLLIPYLAFCILWFIPYWLHDNSKTILNALIHPIPYQFWFIQHLMLLSLLSGIIYWLRQYKYIILPVILLLYVISNKRWGGFEESLLFYILGIWFANSRTTRFTKLPLLFFLTAIALILLCLIYENNIYIHHLMVLCGSLSVIIWLFSSTKVIKPMIPPGLAFFIFACHEPILSILKTTALKLVPITSLNTLLLYIILPTLTVFICILLYKTTYKLHPKLLGIITGNRHTPHQNQFKTNQSIKLP